EGAIIQYDDKVRGGNDNQRWSWEGNGRIRRLKSKSSGLVLDVGEGGGVVRRIVPVVENPAFAAVAPSGPRVVPGDRPAQPPSAGRGSLPLRSGHTIPCDVSHFDENGVTVKTARS